MSRIYGRLMGIAVISLFSACSTRVETTRPEADQSIADSPRSVGRVSDTESPLVAPPGFSRNIQHREKSAKHCPEDAQPYTGTLDFPSKFKGSDDARDDLNEKAEAEYKKRIAPIRNFERGLNRQVEDYLGSGNPVSLNCATRLLGAWAKSDALMGESTTHTGKSMRKWALGSAAASYLRLKSSTSKPLESMPQLQAMTEAWLDRLAAKVVLEWNDPPLRKMNNHEYWAAWSVMATAVVLNDHEYFQWAMKQFHIGASQIDEDGFLPNELSRDTRALYYHNYAITPLMMIAAFARANEVEIPGEEISSLRRLADLILSGVEDPSPFDERTGSKQNLSDFTSESKFAWIEIHCWTLGCRAETRAYIEKMRPLENYRLGGNITDLFAPEGTLVSSDKSSNR